MPPSTAMAPTRTTMTQPTTSGLLQPPLPGGIGRGVGLNGDAGGGGDCGSIRSSEVTGNDAGLSVFLSPPAVGGQAKPPPWPSCRPYRPIMQRMEYEPLPPRPSRLDPPSPPRSRSLVRWMWPVLLALIVGAVSGVAIAAAIHVPRVEAMGSFTPSLVTQLLDRNGHAFATFARERRVMLKESEMPQIMENAVLASEDANFFRHGGIDAMGIARAAAGWSRGRRRSACSSPAGSSSRATGSGSARSKRPSWPSSWRRTTASRRS